MPDLPWTHKSITPMTAKRAYSNGYAAGKRGSSLDRAEDNYTRRYGSQYLDNFNRGYTDAANGVPKSFR